MAVMVVLPTEAGACAAGPPQVEDRIGEQRDVPEHVMEDVRLLQIIDLLGRADEAARHKGAVCQMAEEVRIGHQARRGDHLPAGQLLEPLGQFVEVGNARLGHAQDIEALEEGRTDPPRQHLRLSLEECVPHGVFSGCVAPPVLRDGPVGGRTGRRRWQGLNAAHVRKLHKLW
jgi:hypothetical protein